MNGNNADVEHINEQFYGVDSDGLRPLADDQYGVVVPPAEVPNMDNISNYVMQQVNVEEPSPQAGIDIYIRVLQIVVQKLEE